MTNTLTFEAKAIGPEAKALKILPWGASRPDTRHKELFQQWNMIVSKAAEFLASANRFHSQKVSFTATGADLDIVLTVWSCKDSELVKIDIHWKLHVSQ